MKKLVVNQSEQGDELTLMMSGHIDEEVDFSKLEVGNHSKVILDLGAISGINSCGIRQWITWMASLTQRQQLVFRHCPKIIVDQINMVDGFLPVNGFVESFYVPYYSDYTQEERNVLFTWGIEFDTNGVMPPENVVDQQNNPMEMDVLEAKYFRFLSRKIP